MPHANVFLSMVLASLGAFAVSGRAAPPAAADEPAPRRIFCIRGASGEALFYAKHVYKSESGYESFLRAYDRYPEMGGSFYEELVSHIKYRGTKEKLDLSEYSPGRLMLEPMHRRHMQGMYRMVVPTAKCAGLSYYWPSDIMDFSKKTASLDYDAFCQLWLEKYAKPLVEYFYYEHGVHIFDFGQEGWWPGWRERGEFEQWYPFDDVTGDLIKTKQDVERRIIRTHRALYEWKVRHLPKVILACSYHGNAPPDNLLEFATKCPWFDWIGRDYGTWFGVENWWQSQVDLFGPVARDPATPVWGVADGETSFAPPPVYYGHPDSPYAGVPVFRDHRGQSLQELMEAITVRDPQRLIRMVNYNSWVAETYHRENPEKIMRVPNYWHFMPYKFLDSDEPKGTRPTWSMDWDKDGSTSDLDDPAHATRALYNRFGPHEPAPDQNPLWISLHVAGPGGARFGIRWEGYDADGRLAARGRSDLWDQPVTEGLSEYKCEIDLSHKDLDRVRLVLERTAGEGRLIVDDWVVRSFWSVPPELFTGKAVDFTKPEESVLDWDTAGVTIGRDSTGAHELSLSDGSSVTYRLPADRARRGVRGVVLCRGAAGANLELTALGNNSAGSAPAQLGRVVLDVGADYAERPFALGWRQQPSLKQVALVFRSTGGAVVLNQVAVDGLGANSLLANSDFEDGLRSWEGEKIESVVGKGADGSDAAGVAGWLAQSIEPGISRRTQLSPFYYCKHHLLAKENTEWGRGPWPLMIGPEQISYDEAAGRLRIRVRNLCAPMPISSNIRVYARKVGEPAWDVTKFTKCTPTNVGKSLAGAAADLIGYVDGNSYAVPGNGTLSTDHNTKTFEFPWRPSGGKRRIDVYIEDTRDVKGWTATRRF